MNLELPAVYPVKIEDITIFLNSRRSNILKRYNLMVTGYVFNFLNKIYEIENFKEIQVCTNLFS